MRLNLKTLCLWKDRQPAIFIDSYKNGSRYSRLGFSKDGIVLSRFDSKTGKPYSIHTEKKTELSHAERQLVKAFHMLLDKMQKEGCGIPAPDNLNIDEIDRSIKLKGTSYYLFYVRVSEDNIEGLPVKKSGVYLYNKETQRFHHTDSIFGTVYPK